MKPLLENSLKNIACIYIAKPEFIEALCSELKEVSAIVGNAVFSPQINSHVCFALDMWFEPQIVTFQSISEAVKILRQAGKYWYLHPINHIRRSRLIEEQLVRLPALNTPFSKNISLPVPAIGGFTLLDQNTLVYSTRRLKKWPDGHCFFIEDKNNPPNRAYLKLWEALFLLGKYPQSGHTVLDLGASPGGWTYVMHSLDATVTAVDKAPLDQKIASLPRVTSLQQSAFAIDPTQMIDGYDWVLSDIACYPDRAYALILKWITSGKAKQLIFTIKLQGKIDLATLKRFQQIPNSRMLNLFYNKNETTFFYPAC